MATRTQESGRMPPGRSRARQNGSPGAAVMELVREAYPPENAQFIERALRFAIDAHSGQTRKSGAPFIEHPIATADYLAQLNMDADMVAAGLLHDTMEDCGVEFQELVKAFNPEVAGLVESVTKLNADGSLVPWNPDGSVPISTDGPGANQQEAAAAAARAASMRKMFVAMARDVRVVVIKLADRLHNMLTLKALPHHRQIAIARETLDIYAPLAHRLGMWDLKWRLEDESFKYLHPAEFRAISRLLQRKRIQRELYVDRATDALKKALDDAGVESEVTGRAKHIYSIHQKTQRYAAMGKKLEDIYDLFALRVFVATESDCYAALGAIHGTWPPISGQFDDYIASPKENMYQSLHTTVRALDGFPVEIQIRTPVMHNVSENGIAAHALYKEGRSSKDRFEEGMTLMRQLLESDRDHDEDFEWLEQIKTDILQDQVFVYTPRGDVIELPAGATPLDFAYMIHTDLGHQTGGAVVNGKLMALNTPLHNGDTITIQKSKGQPRPKLDWLNPDLGYLKTASAQNKVRQWFRRQERAAQQNQGREFLSRQLRRLHEKMSHEQVAEAMGCGSTTELYELIGSGELHAGEVVARLMSTADDSAENLRQPEVPLEEMDSTSGTIVMGMSGLLTREAKCCSPVYGDDIVGYLTMNRGVTIHRSLCPNLRGKDQPERLVEVDWGHLPSRTPARFKIEAWDRVGLIRDLTSVVGAEKVNIHSLTSVEDESTSTCSVTLTVYTTGSKQLSRLFSRLENVRGVFGIVRQGLH